LSHLYRSRKISENTQLIINEQSLINFCSNDYLSLAKHPKIKQAFKQGIDKFVIFLAPFI
jgi:8-amino-7-oxononanoate synthase